MGNALGNLIAGLVAGQFERMPLVQVFGAVAALAIGSGLFFLVLKGPIARLGGDVRQTIWNDRSIDRDARRPARVPGE